MIVLLDCDGVLADFLSPALAALHACGGPALAHDELDRYSIESLLDTAEQRAAWWSAVTAPGFCASLQPYAGARECVDDLRAMKHDVLCVTSPMDSLTWAGERAAWLRDRFGFARNHIISTPGKQWVAGDFLADDNENHCDDWGARYLEASPILIARPYNDGEHTLADFVELVGSMT
jgi:5'(3')-deoxyribonucleotidase